MSKNNKIDKARNDIALFKCREVRVQESRYAKEKRKERH